MGKQLSLFVDDDIFSITDEDVAPKQAKQKEEMVSFPDPFVEANKAFFGIEEGEQIEIDFLTIPGIEEEESMSFQEVVRKLEECRKYTLFMFDDLTGFPTSIHLKMISATVEPYAQYDEALYLTYRVKRHRSDSQFIFLPYKSFIIWEGHIDVDTNMWGKLSRVSSQVMAGRSKYGKFDKHYLTDGVTSTGCKPVVEYRPANAIA